jgi:hypothetical protein
MGGAAGHIKHLYEDHELRFRDLLELAETIHGGRLAGATEKLDGQALTFSWHPVAGLRVARGLGDIVRGGMGEPELAARFPNKPNVILAFVGGFRALQGAIGRASVDLLLSTFGEAQRWYNAEIISEDNPNVVRYVGNHVVIHGCSSFRVVDGKAIKDSCRPDALDPILGPGTLDAAGWTVRGPVPINFSARPDSCLPTFQRALQHTLAVSDLGLDSTIADYLRMRLVPFVEELHLPIRMQCRIVARALKLPGYHNLTLLKQQCPEFSWKIGEFVERSELLVKILRRPIVGIVQRLAVDTLAFARSPMVVSHQRSLQMMHDAVRACAAQIEADADPEQVELLHDNLDDLTHYGGITSSIEGVVFPWRGQTYKLTGCFAPVNQILGIQRYDRTRMGTVRM